MVLISSEEIGGGQLVLSIFLTDEFFCAAVLGVCVRVEFYHKIQFIFS